MQVAAAGPGFFDTLGVTLEEGRALDQSDRAGGAPVVVINRAMADRYWPGENALGKRFRFFGMEPVEVVGIAEVLKYGNPGEDPQPYAYLPLAQYHVPNINVLARTSVDPDGVLLAAQCGAAPHERGPRPLPHHRRPGPRRRAPGRALDGGAPRRARRGRRCCSRRSASTA